MSSNIGLFNTIEYEVQGHTLRLRKAGVSELYELTDALNAIMEESEQHELMKELERLRKLDDIKTPEEQVKHDEVLKRLNAINIETDKMTRKFLIEHAISIRRGDETGSQEDARHFIDTLDSFVLADVMKAVMPDLEKNLQSQS